MVTTVPLVRTMVAEAFKASMTSPFHLAASPPAAANAEKSACLRSVCVAMPLCQVSLPGGFTRVTIIVFPPLRISAAVAEVIVPVMFTALSVLIVKVEGTKVTVPDV